MGTQELDSSGSLASVCLRSVPFEIHPQLGAYYIHILLLLCHTVRPPTLFVVPATATAATAALRPHDNVSAALTSPLHRRLRDASGDTRQLHRPVLGNAALVRHGALGTTQNIRRHHHVQVARLEVE